MIEEKESKFADWMIEMATPNGDCLECHYSAVSHGYCKVSGSNEWAHRFVYRMKVGPINGLWVLHTCDNRRCINPKHLWLGTNKDNSRDRDEKGRTSCQGRPRLTNDKEVEQMKLLRERGYSYEYISTFFMISRDSVRNALNRANG